MAKYKLTYFVEGEIEIEAENEASAISNFQDRVGFSEDEIYENLNHNFVVVDVNEVNE